MRRWIPVVAASVLLLSGCVSSSAESVESAEGAADAATTSSEPTPEIQLRVGEPTDPPPAETVEFAESLQAATAFAAEQGITVGIAVLDRQTGLEYTNGSPAGRQMWSASVSKLFLADDLLHRDRIGEIALTDADRVLLGRMLELSDDSAADTLYFAYGTEAMVTEVSQRYDLPAITASNDPGEWELTDISAVSVVRWFDRFLTTAPAGDRDLVVGLLQSTDPVAADGFDQTFGLPMAVTDQPLAYKQGWMCCPASTSFLHTTALIGTDQRYAVAVLTERPSDSGYATDALDRIARLAFPAGVFVP